MKGEGGTKEGRKGSFEMRVTNSPLHLYHLPQMMKTTMMKTTAQVDTQLQKQIANTAFTLQQPQPPCTLTHWWWVGVKVSYDVKPFEAAQTVKARVDTPSHLRRTRLVSASREHILWTLSHD